MSLDLTGSTALVRGNVDHLDIP